MGSALFPSPDEIDDLLVFVNKFGRGNFSAIVEDQSVFIFAGDTKCYVADSNGEAHAFLLGYFYGEYRGEALDVIQYRDCLLRSSVRRRSFQEDFRKVAAEKPLSARRSESPADWPKFGFSIPNNVADVTLLLNASSLWHIVISRDVNCTSVLNSRRLIFCSSEDLEIIAFLSGCFLHTFRGDSIDDIMESLSPGCSNKAAIMEALQRADGARRLGNREEELRELQKIKDLYTETASGRFQGLSIRDILDK